MNSYEMQHAVKQHEEQARRQAEESRKSKQVNRQVREESEKSLWVAARKAFGWSRA